MRNIFSTVYAKCTDKLYRQSVPTLTRPVGLYTQERGEGGHYTTPKSNNSNLEKNSEQKTKTWNRDYLISDQASSGPRLIRLTAITLNTATISGMVTPTMNSGSDDIAVDVIVTTN